MGQRTQRDEKKGGGRKWLKESFRCRCDPAAEYFNVTAIRGRQAPFGHPPRITRDKTFLCAVQSKNYPSFTANASCSTGTADATEEKDSRILQTRLFFSSLSPRCCEPEVLYNVRYNLPFQTPRQPWSPLILVPGAYPQAHLCSARRTTQACGRTPCVLPLGVPGHLQSSHQVTTSFPNKKPYQIIPQKCNNCPTSWPPPLFPAAFSTVKHLLICFNLSTTHLQPAPETGLSLDSPLHWPKHILFFTK